jgi:lipopolysaccharide/colanic/teichoic acid biosynthesis glycosyltransferase
VAAGAGKRSVEAIIAVLLIGLCIPMLVFLALGAAISLRAWPFFTQVRAGLHGAPFRIIKVRTLTPTTSRCATKYELATAELPWFCRSIRRLHLDEIPQLWLVVTGKMSLVGPRPEMPALHADLEDDFAVARTSVRPGCTGLWQIGQHCGRMIGEHPEYDEFYLAHRGFRLDAWIIAKSVWVMLPFSSGELVTLTDVPQWVVRRRRGARNLHTADAA